MSDEDFLAGLDPASSSHKPSDVKGNSLMMMDVCLLPQTRHVLCQQLLLLCWLVLQKP